MPTESHANSRVVDKLVQDLAHERDTTALVRGAAEMLATALGAPHFVAAGEGGLAGLQLGAANATEKLAVRAPAWAREAPAERIQVLIAEAVCGFRLWLPKHAALTLAFLDARMAPDAARGLLEATAHYLFARLTDVAELQRALLANTALERRISDLSLLFKGLDVTLASVELTKVLRAFLTCVTSGEAIGFNRAFLLLLDEENQQLRGSVAVGPNSAEEAGTIWRSLDEQHASLEEVLRRAIGSEVVEPVPGSLAARIRSYVLPLDPARSILARAAVSDGMYSIHTYRGEGAEPFADAFGSREFVVIPILGRERPLGVIVADNLYTGKPLGDDRVYLLLGLANHVGVVIENALMFEDLSRRYAELNEVQHINRALLSSDDYGGVLQQIAEISAAMLDASGALLFAAEGQPGVLRLQVQYSVAGQPLASRFVHECTEIALGTLERDDGGFDSDVRWIPEGTNNTATANLVSAPMSIDNEVVGVLVVFRETPDSAGRFDRRSRRFLSIIADQAAIAVLSGRRLETILDDQHKIDELNDLLYRNEKLAALGQASSQIAHEIRNPLTALGGFARRIQRSVGLDLKDREAVDVIVRETARLERILNDQLAFVRSAKLQRRPAQLNSIVREACNLLQPQLESRGIRVEAVFDTKLPDAELDADRIKQVLVNLLMNAIAATEQNGRIGVATRQRGDGTLELEVANTGPPIPTEVADTLFLPFATTRAEGTGLGLAVVYQIVTEHGGSIAVRRDPPFDSVFQILLPRNASATLPLHGPSAPV